MKKRKHSQGHNLRILAIAYANSRLDREAYIRLRTQQLSALDFNKPIPPLPEELGDIKIPSIKIDAPRDKGRSRLAGKKLNLRLWGSVAAVLLITIIACGVYLWFNGGLEYKAPQTVQMSLQDNASKLIANPTWSDNDIETFRKLWASRSSQAKSKARQSDWYLALENEIIKRINQMKLQRNSAADVRQHQTQLNSLRLLYAALKAD